MKWYCTVCGYVYEGPEAPEACPVCKAPKEKFKQMDEEASFATVHEVGVAQGVSEDILKDLRANFEGECSEVGMYLAFGKKPLAVRRGGSIPIISTFEQVLGIKTVLMGFGLESNAIHSPNENFPLDIFRKGIEAVVEFHISL